VDGREPTLADLDRGQLGELPVAAIAVRGKELQLDDTVSEARQLLTGRAVKVLPVLDGQRYLGAVDRDLLAEAPGDDAPVRSLAEGVLPVVVSTMPARNALDVLDEDGGTRLVVLAEDAATYVGVVCLRGDRKSLCVDASVAQGAGR
jgi:CBS-domain-containing membrane protein